MWNFASNAIAGTFGKKIDITGCSSLKPDCSDDEASSCASREEGLECPICWESFNLVENVPYVLWCGHTMCKNCILGLQWAVVKFPALPVQLPLFISCPWCDVLSLRVVYKGNLKFPRKNYFLLWMVERMNGERVKSHSSHDERQLLFPSHISLFGHRHHARRADPVGNHTNAERTNDFPQKVMDFFVQLTVKFPLVIIFLLIVLYAVPASATVLALYALLTVLFALPSILILYFAYPSLNWLIREILT